MATASFLQEESYHCVDNHGGTEINNTVTLMVPKQRTSKSLSKHKLIAVSSKQAFKYFEADEQLSR